MQVFAPVAPHVTGDAQKNEQKLSDAEQNVISVKNVINNASWRICDIMITTPRLFGAVLDDKDSYDPEGIAPSTIVVDEYDYLL